MLRVWHKIINFIHRGPESQRCADVLEMILLWKKDENGTETLRTNLAFPKSQHVFISVEVLCLFYSMLIPEITQQIEVVQSEHKQSSLKENLIHSMIRTCGLFLILGFVMFL